MDTVRSLLKDLHVAKENVQRLEAIVMTPNVKQSELSHQDQNQVDIILPAVQQIDRTLRAAASRP